MGLGQERQPVATVSLTVVDPNEKPVPGATVFVHTPNNAIRRFFKTDAAGQLVLMGDSKDIEGWGIPVISQKGQRVVAYVYDVPTELKALGLGPDPKQIVTVDPLSEGNVAGKLTLAQVESKPAAPPTPPEEGNTFWWILGGAAILGIGGWIYYRRRVKDGLLDEPGEPIPAPEAGMPRLTNKAPKVEYLRY